MKLRRPETRTPPETIVALIDVVFFLLVFFMLVGRMDATAPFEVQPPLSEGGADLPGGGATVSIGLDEELALEGTLVSRAGLLARLEERLAAEPALPVRLNAHGGAPLRALLPLAAEIEALGAQDIVLIVTREGGG